MKAQHIGDPCVRDDSSNVSKNKADNVNDGSPAMLRLETL